ncbi:MAG: tRNA pseudouridine13 synthase [Chlamydiales bacterium]|jgi:tRNA pseudouridine13 synthase
MAPEDQPGGAPPWAPGYRHLTPEISPIPFQFRMRPQDFRVEEVPLEEPDGEGTHIFLELEKRGLSTVDAVRRLARALERPEHAFGFAGRKDTFAITRQWISVEHVDPATVAAIEIEDASVLRVTRHRKKLRLGQLAGNRFQLRLVQMADGDRENFERVLASLSSGGLPNYYGAQRFGRHGFTYRLGRLLVQRRYRDYLDAFLSPEHNTPSASIDELAEVFRTGSPSAQRRLTRIASSLPPDLAALAHQLARRPGDVASGVRAIPKRTRRFHLSSFQSRVFNRVLAARLGEGLSLGEVVPGDVVYEHSSGRATLLEKDAPVPEEAQARATAFETSPSGPMPGTRALAAEGLPGELEQAALAAEELSIDDFKNLPEGFAQNGARRPLRVPVTEVQVGWSPASADLRFRLPKGAFATTLLEELRKDFRGP